MTLSARRAELPDLAVVQGITRAAYHRYLVDLGFEPQPMNEDYGLSIKAGDVWLVSDKAAPIAVAVLASALDHLMIHSLAVIPEAQGAGIGRWMLQFAMGRAKALGVPEVRLYTNARMTRNLRGCRLS